MFNEKRVLIIGFGSIGRRHLNNIIDLGFKKIFIVSKSLKKLNDFPFVKIFSEISHVFEINKIDFSLICSSTSNHYSDFLKLCKYDIKNIYIEKPISNNLLEAKKMLKISLSKDLNVLVGFDLRFDLGLIKVKKLVEDKIIGDICTFRCEVGQFLPDWRSNISYSESSSSKSIHGGGVMLDLIHEFDYVEWILGEFQSVFGKNIKSSNLKIDTEDNSLNILSLENNVYGTICLDYLQKKLSRSLKIIGNNGMIIWDYSESKVIWIKNNETIYNKYSYSHFSRNDRFKEILTSFFKSESNLKADNRLTTIKESLSSLNVVINAKKSNKLNKLIKL